MPKLGMQPIRRRALIDAAISAIGARGSLDVTMTDIAGRAGVSTALAHHYFGAKDELLAATMWHLLADLGLELRRKLQAAEHSARAHLHRCRSQLFGRPVQPRSRGHMACLLCRGAALSYIAPPAAHLRSPHAVEPVVGFRQADDPSGRGAGGRSGGRSYRRLLYRAPCGTGCPIHSAPSPSSRIMSMPSWRPRLSHEQ